MISSKTASVPYIMYCSEKYGDIIEMYCMLFFEELKSISPINLSLSLDTLVDRSEDVCTCGSYGGGVVYLELTNLCIILDNFLNQGSHEGLGMNDEFEIHFTAKQLCFYIVFHEICHSLQLGCMSSDDPKYADYIEEDNAKTMVRLMNTHPTVIRVIDKYKLTDYIVMDSINMYFITKDFYHDARNHTLELSIEYLLSELLSLVISETPNHDNSSLMEAVKRYTDQLNNNPFSIDIILTFDTGKEAQYHSYINCINGVHDKQAMNEALEFFFQYRRPYMWSRNQNLSLTLEENGFNLRFSCHLMYRPVTIMEQ